MMPLLVKSFVVKVHTGARLTGSGDFEQDLSDLNRHFGRKHSDRNVLTDEHLGMAL